MTAWILDTCTEANSQKSSYAVLHDSLVAYRNGGGKVVLSDQLVRELEQKAADGLLDIQLTQLGEFHRLDQVIHFDLATIKVDDQAGFSKLTRIRNKVRRELNGRCRDHFDEDWHLIAPALHFSVPILTFEKELLRDCLCRIIAVTPELLGVIWFVWDGKGIDLNGALANNALLGKHTIDEVCKEMSKQRVTKEQGKTKQIERRALRRRTPR